MSSFEVSLMKKKHCVPKFRGNDSYGSCTLKKWEKIGYHVEHYFATLRTSEAEEDKQRPGWPAEEKT